MKSRDVLKILRITRPTLTQYVKNGKLKVTRLPNGFYDYDNDSVYKAAGIATERVSVVYARVSTAKQTNDLQNQIATVTNYANTNGYQVAKVYSDIASGLSYDRDEFKALLMDVIARKIKVVFIENKDRLTRVSFDMWKDLFHEYDCELVAINDVVNAKTEEEEIFAEHVHH